MPLADVETVMTGVDVSVATEPANPLALATLTLVTVPDPPPPPVAFRVPPLNVRFEPMVTGDHFDVPDR